MTLGGELVRCEEMIWGESGMWRVESWGVGSEGQYTASMYFILTKTQGDYLKQMAVRRSCALSCLSCLVGDY
jgi:hypothetical protein